jgi:sterol desaturase/sphingolipid hydroxylase (fatty acid hydroxylase superfamily)
MESRSLLPTSFHEWHLALIIAVFSFSRYLLIAGICYLICYSPGVRSLRRFKIQPCRPHRKQVINELKYSLSTVVIFSLMGLLIFHLYCAGFTTIYLEVKERGFFYLAASLLGLIVVHDSYFYWTHRLLHTRWFFRHVHAVHHLSTNPTPWAAYSFHPLEAMMQSFILLPMVTLFPIHLGILILFTFIVLMMNVLGHLGYEFYPARFKSTLAGKWLTSSTHHNLHHQHGSKNFGYYFIIWDLLMATLKDNNHAKSKLRA